MLHAWISGDNLLAQFSKEWFIQWCDSYHDQMVAILSLQNANGPQTKRAYFPFQRDAYWSLNPFEAFASYKFQQNAYCVTLMLWT